MFGPEEWRTAQQISSFFSRLSAIQRRRQTERGQLEEPRDEIPGGDLEALESEIVFNDLRQAVLRDVTMPYQSHSSRDKECLRAIKGKETSNAEVI